MNFDELILEAAKSIAAATAALIKAASEAQKELVSQGKLQVSVLHNFLESSLMLRLNKLVCSLLQTFLDSSC
jgi:hypothetical protein